MLKVRSPRFYPFLSVAAALVTMAVKFIDQTLDRDRVTEVPRGTHQQRRSKGEKRWYETMQGPNLSPHV